MVALCIVIIAAILFSAFFSGIEIAFVSANKLRIELEREQNLFPSKLISIFVNNQDQFIVTMLVGNIISLITFGIATAQLFTPLLTEIITSTFVIILIQTIIATLVILFTAEHLPKNIFKNRSNAFLNILAVPVFFFYILLYPVTRLIIAISKIILRAKLPIDTDETICNILNRSNLILDKQPGKSKQETNVDNELKIFHNALNFSQIKIRECSIPRTEIVALEENDSVDNLRNKFIETGFSKIPIYRNTIDNIIGYVHSAKLFEKPQTIKEKLNHIPIAPETMPAKKLLSSLLSQQKSIALVVDEFGGTAGIVTMEDIMEEIFGEIEDEHDTSEMVEKQISKNTFLLSARHEIDYLNETYGLNIPESENYETIAGYIFTNYQNIPDEGEKIDIGNFIFQIVKVTHNKIELVKLIIKENIAQES